LCTFELYWTHSVAFPLAEKSIIIPKKAASQKNKPLDSNNSINILKPVHDKESIFNK